VVRLKNAHRHTLLAVSALDQSFFAFWIPFFFDRAPIFLFLFLFVTLARERSLRSKAEERVGRRCGNLRVLNSYWVRMDGEWIDTVGTFV
jgi:hypothetical protein